MNLQTRIQELEQRLEELERTSEDDAPFDKATARRELLIQIAIDAADAILMGFAEGSIEEMNYLTSQIALKWAERAAERDTQANHSRELERKKAS